MKRRSWLLSLMLLSLLPVISGCVAVVAAGGAAGGVAYVRGELQATLDEPVTAVNEAVIEAGEALGLNSISAAGDKLGGEFVFRNAQDEKVTIQTEPVTEKSTELGIRIGLFGDQARSQLILDAIKEEL